MCSAAVASWWSAAAGIRLVAGTDPLLGARAADGALHPAGVWGMCQGDECTAKVRRQGTEVQSFGLL